MVYEADAIRVKVGYPLSPNTEDSSSIARYYNSVKVNKTNFFDNVLNAQSVFFFPYSVVMIFN
jgi:endothelin-converting enzyme